MRVSDVMSRDVKTIQASGTAESARARMDNNRVRHLVVMDSGTVAGVISDRDLGRPTSRTGQDARRVTDVMTAQAVTAKPEHTIRQAANLMRGRGIGCLPVIKDGKLKGIVTVTDLLELLGRGLVRPIPRTERAVLSRRHGKYMKTPARPRG